MAWHQGQLWGWDGPWAAHFPLVQHPPSSRHCLQLLRPGDNLNVHRWMNEFLNVVYTHDGLLFSLKEGTPAACNNMDEPGGHYAK